jgi:hypothetical protein
MKYPRKHWYPSQDETFELGCLVIPSTCFLLFTVSQLFPIQLALLFGLLLLLGAFALLYYQNWLKKDSIQKVFRTQRSRMNQIVEKILNDKQLPHDKSSKGRKNSYRLNDNGIEITIGPYIYTVYKPSGRYRRVEDGIVVKIRAQEPTQDMLINSIKNKIDERIKPYI